MEKFSEKKEMDTQLIEVFYELGFSGETIISENFNTFLKKNSEKRVTFLNKNFQKHTKFVNQIIKKKKELMIEFTKLCIVKKVTYEEDNYPFLDIFVKILIDKQMVHEWKFKFSAKLFTMNQDIFKEEILKVFQWNLIQQKIEEDFFKEEDEKQIGLMPISLANSLIKKNEGKQTVIFNLPFDLYSFLKEYSNKNNVSMNSVICALCKWLKKSEESEKENR